MKIHGVGDPGGATQNGPGCGLAGWACWAVEKEDTAGVALQICRPSEPEIPLLGI